MNIYSTPCEQRLYDCFANEKGYCQILDNAHFKRRCPFYKKSRDMNMTDWRNRKW